MPPYFSARWFAGFRQIDSMTHHQKNSWDTSGKSTEHQGISAWQEAVLKLNEVQHVEAYNAAIAACGKAHKCQVSLDLLHKLRQTHLKATIVSFMQLAPVNGLACGTAFNFAK